MPRRSLLSRAARDAFFGIPAGISEITRIYVLGPNDLDLVRSRRGAANQLGLALHLALVRHPGFGWRDGECPPPALIDWMAHQTQVAPDAITDYTKRGATRSEHRCVAAAHLDLRSFTNRDLQDAKTAAAAAAFATDDGVRIMEGLLAHLRGRRMILPSEDVLERIGIAGRARARRLAAAALVAKLDADHLDTLDRLLEVDPDRGTSDLAWLRDIPESPSPDNLHAILERRRAVQALGLPTSLGEDIHPARLQKFAREGAVAPAFLLSDFGARRRHATLAAQMAALEVRLADAAIGMFEKLIGTLFTRSRRSHERKFQATTRDVGRLMRLFGGTIDAIQTSIEQDEDAFEAIEDAVGWWKLLKVRDQVNALGAMADEDPLVSAAGRYTYLRRFAPAFLDAFEFKAPRVGASLLGAIDLLRAHNRSGKRKLPEAAPAPFPAKHWKGLIFEGGAPDRRLYETAVMTTLRDRLRAGDVWVDGTSEYRRFDAYLVARDEALDILADTALPTDGTRWLRERRHTLDTRLEQFQSRLHRGDLPGVRMKNGRLKITPHDPVTPPESEALDRTIDALMPRIRITELLWDVAGETGFLDCFRDLRSGKAHDNPAAILAAILAGATNLGLERMAQASTGVTYAQLSWASTWYLRPETYRDALARVIDAHHAHPFVSVWSEIDNSSSDGQFFPSGRRSGEINAKYGPDPGLKIYSFLSGQYGSFDSSVISATAGEAPYVLDGLLGNAASFVTTEHFTDTGGVSDLVFALFHLLGMRFVPRLRDFPDRRLACFGRTSRWPHIASLMGKPINEEVILENWEDVLRFIASIRSGAVTPSDMLRKLGAYRRQNRLHLALGEIGRIERTLFMLDWLEDPELRQRCQAGLCKSEARHTLASAIFAHAQGHVYDRTRTGQQQRAAALNLVIAAIIFWNTTYIAKAVEHLRSTAQLPDTDLLRHVSPLGWVHINLTGEYFWNQVLGNRISQRPLVTKPLQRYA